MWTRKLTTSGAFLALALPALADGPPARDDEPAYFHEGDLAGSLRADSPLPIYDPDPGHPWNRLFAALAIRHSHLPSRRGGPPIERIEGGDRLDFLGWPGTTYWSEPATAARLDALLDEFLGQRGGRLVADPLRRVVFQRDLWAAFDFLVGQNIERRGAPADRRRRDALARKLAAAIEAVALPRESIDALPDNYAAAIASGRVRPRAPARPDAGLPARGPAHPPRGVGGDRLLPARDP